VSTGLRIPFEVVDSALIIAIVIGVFSYAGWTFYPERFSIDPSSLDASSISVAVDGVGAIEFTLLAWLAACAFLLISGACTWAFVRLVERRRGRHGRLTDRTAVMMAQSAGIAFALLFVLWGGTTAGQWAAEKRILNVRNGDVWHHHLKEEVIRAVPNAQGSTTMWLLTRSGIRPIATTEIRLIDGPLFDRIYGGSNGGIATRVVKS